MDRINYHHLLYFWSVAREGSLAGAAKALRLAQSTISKQIHQLEADLGCPLFARSGRRLVLSESGRLVYRYAEEIFGLGREMLGTLRDRPIGKPGRLTVGVADVVPKLLAERVIAPALSLPGGVHLVCREDRPERLLADLALHGLDVVLADVPASPSVGVRAVNHLLGESDITFFASADVAVRIREGFPASLHGAPILLPTPHTALRRALDEWFAASGLRPLIVAEFDDSALLKVFGARGKGVFPAVSVIGEEVQAQYGVEAVGTVPTIREQLFAITVERRIKNPAVVALCEAARPLLLGRSDPDELAHPFGRTRRGSTQQAQDPDDGGRPEE